MMVSNQYDLLNIYNNVKNSVTFSVANNDSYAQHTYPLTPSTQLCILSLKHPPHNLQSIINPSSRKTHSTSHPLSQPSRPSSTLHPDHPPAPTLPLTKKPPQPTNPKITTFLLPSDPVPLSLSVPSP